MEEENNNTVTIKQSKNIDGMNFQFVSVSPSKKGNLDHHLAKKVKQLQDEEAKSWLGINVKYTMRPGKVVSESQLTLPATIGSS